MVWCPAPQLVQLASVVKGTRRDSSGPQQQCEQSIRHSYVVDVMACHVLQLDFCEAKLALQHAVNQAATSYSAYRSGLLRFEVCATSDSLLFPVQSLSGMWNTDMLNRQDILGCTKR